MKDSHDVYKTIIISYNNFFSSNGGGLLWKVGIWWEVTGEILTSCVNIGIGWLNGRIKSMTNDADILDTVVHCILQ